MTMIEKMATAISAAEDAWTLKDGPLYEHLARAAFAAIREPDIYMLQAGYPAMLKANKEQVYGEAIIDRAWRAMIDTALTGA